MRDLARAGLRLTVNLQRHGGFDVVIDDGSHDHTAYIVRSHFMREQRVSVISIPNGGKANALNVGLANARSEVVVALDADTQFESTTISRLVRWFTDPDELFALTLSRAVQ